MDPIPLLCDLVAANSINPVLVPDAPGEAEVAHVVAHAMARAGLDVVRQDAAPDRPNVIGVLEGREPGPTVMFCGHLDTVGVDGMRDPFVPRIEGGRLYGRGAQDMKGGVAAMIAAAAELVSDWSRGRLIVAGVVDEEHMSLGAEALVRQWRADYAVVTEPTDLRLAIGHKGFAWIDVVTRGRAAHGSRPEEGRDAIARMGRVLVALEARDRELRARAPVPFQGTGSLHASIIRGGAELSSYPAECVLHMERRTVSEETANRPRVRSTRYLPHSGRTIANSRPSPRSARTGRRIRCASIIRWSVRFASLSRTRDSRASPPACRSGPTPPSWLTPAFRPSCLDPAARVCTATRNMCWSMTCARAGTCWWTWRGG
jgi:acetylornithine deacetylase/succinyl-diaminopimelate desuccinylase-like protein